MTKKEISQQVVGLLATVEDYDNMAFLEKLEKELAGATGFPLTKDSLQWMLKKIQEKKEMFETSVMAIQASRTQQTNETNKLTN